MDLPRTSTGASEPVGNAAEGPDRILLGWDRPLVAAAAEWLATSLGGPDGDALDGVLCVLPGRRGGRLLLRELAERADRSGRLLAPPTIVTPGSLAARLAARPEPSRLEREFAWLAALAEVAPGGLEAEVLALGDEPALERLGLARRLRRLIDELDAHLVPVARVAEACDEADRPEEAERWRVIAGLDDAVRARLEACGAAGASIEAAMVEDERDAALEAARSSWHQVVLVGVTDLDPAEQRRIEATGVPCTVLVAAPASEAGSIDAWGRPRIEAWMERGLPASVYVEVADGLEAQAAIAVEAVAEAVAADPGLALDEVVVASADEDVFPALARRLARAGVPAHRPRTGTLAGTPPGRLLAGLLGWAREGRFEDLAALARHPDLAREARLAALDERAAARVPWRDSVASLLEAVRTSAPDWTSRLDADVHLAWCLRLATLLRGLGGPARPVGEWMDPLVRLLGTVYGALDEEGAEWTVQSCLAFQVLAEGVARLPVALQPVLDGVAALELYGRLAADAPEPPRPERDRIELLGWREVLLDDAPVLVLAGVHDGTLPEAPPHDPWLPPVLRERLGLVGDDARRARDAFGLVAAAMPRRRAIVVSARTGEDGRPLVPSRVLLAGPKDGLPDRVERLTTAEGVRPAPPVPRGAPAAGRRGIPALEPHGFVVPDVAAHLTSCPASLRVTDFRSYLRCPARFAMERLLGLRQFEDDVRELDPLAFGTLAHAALEALGPEGALATATSEAEIRAGLHARLAMLVRERLGPRPSPAVRLQLERLQGRLADWAAVEAADRAEGWRPVAIELTIADALLPVPGQAPMRIRGRLDRLDHNAGTGGWRVLDYKTGDGGERPDAAHGVRRSRKKGHPIDLERTRWRDVQLPLYRLMIAGREIDGHRIPDTVDVGYGLLARRPEDVRVEVADWDADVHASALDAAAEVVRGIRAAAFVPSDDPAGLHDPHAWILQTAAFGDGDADDAEVGALS